MPLYEYACASCKKKIEVLQGFNEKPIKNCPHCGGKLKKLMSSPAIQFKGSGWYVTDYGGKSGSADASEKSSEKSAEPSAETKSSKESKDSKNSKDSKAETKKTDKPPRKDGSSKKD